MVKVAVAVVLVEDRTMINEEVRMVKMEQADVVAEGVITEGEKVVREAVEQEQVVVVDVEVADEVKEHIIRTKSTSDMM